MLRRKNETQLVKIRTTVKSHRTGMSYVIARLASPFAAQSCTAGARTRYQSSSELRPASDWLAPVKHGYFSRVSEGTSSTRWGCALSHAAASYDSAAPSCQRR